MEEIFVSAVEKKKKTITTGGGLMGLQVIGSDGKSKGTVKDITFVVGKKGMTLIVESKQGDNSEIDWEDIQAVDEFVILKAKSSEAQISVDQPEMRQPAQAESHLCPTCWEPLTFIPKYNRWYCYKDRKYV
jgi:sporulation protein YlmC with PRC-barrel domain